MGIEAACSGWWLVVQPDQPSVRFFHRCNCEETAETAFARLASDVDWVILCHGVRLIDCSGLSITDALAELELEHVRRSPKLAPAAATVQLLAA